MRFKKAFGKIYDVELNAKEQEILNQKVQEEIQKMMPEYITEAAKEVDSIILWYLHENEKTKFGHKRLKEFYLNFHVKLDELMDWYKLGENDRSWLCSYKLKQYGLDIEELQKDIGERRGDTDESSDNE